MIYQSKKIILRRQQKLPNKIVMLLIWTRERNLTRNKPTWRDLSYLKRMLFKRIRQTNSVIKHPFIHNQILPKKTTKNVWIRESKNKVWRTRKMLIREWGMKSMAAKCMMTWTKGTITNGSFVFLDPSLDTKNSCTSSSSKMHSQNLRIKEESTKLRSTSWIKKLANFWNKYWDLLTHWSWRKASKLNWSMFWLSISSVTDTISLMISWSSSKKTSLPKATISVSKL